ncbi:MAG: UDP-N-acetylmuramate--alanine ligase [Maritimibacter sp.]|nr:UDP-N-acetylmuramate--alanine ligase [Maritimibacter sp.]
MSLPLLLACLWVVAASLTALLPMRLQMAPGLALLLSAPPLLYWIGITHGLLPTLFGVFAVLSLFRRPLIHLARKLGGAS